MNWLDIAWLMLAGTCATFAFLSFRVAFGDRRYAPYIFLGVASISVGAICGLELALMRSTDLAEYNFLLRWAVVPIWVMVASVAGFIRTFFGAGRVGMALLAVGLNGVAQIANITSTIPCVRYAVSLRRVETFGGVHFTLPIVHNGPWDWVDMLSVALLLAFFVDASFAVWRRGQRRRAVLVGGGVTFFLFASRGHAILVEKGILQTPYFVSFCFVGVLVAMGRELADDVVRAARLSRVLQAREKEIALAARAAALGFWTWDTGTNAIWASPSARSLFGFPPEGRIDFDAFLKVVHPKDREELQAAISDTLKWGGEYVREYRILLPDGTQRWIGARGRVESLKDGAPPLLRGVVIDNTSIRKSEMELQNARAQLAHVGRVSMLGQLASALAHELNQPLGAILRNAEAAEIFLNSEKPDLDELRAIISDIRDDDQRAGQVIDRLRSMLKRRELEPQEIEVGSLLSEVLTLARADAAIRRVSIEIADTAGVPNIKGDRIHLQQVLLNLLINSMDAMQEKTDVARKVVLSAQAASGDMVSIAVSDTGRGIPPEILAQVFEPFFTTKTHGMGMGLAISRTIIAAHGGEMSAESNAQGPGATFRFTLPRASAVSRP